MEVVTSAAGTRIYFTTNPDHALVAADRDTAYRSLAMKHLSLGTSPLPTVDEEAAEIARTLVRS